MKTFDIDNINLCYDGLYMSNLNDCNNKLSNPMAVNAKTQSCTKLEWLETPRVLEPKSITVQKNTVN